MATLRYKLNEVPNCPSCGKPLDEGLAADFVVCIAGRPTGLRTRDTCGLCAKPFIATPSEDRTQIIFSNE